MSQNGCVGHWMSAVRVVVRPLAVRVRVPRVVDESGGVHLSPRAVAHPAQQQPLCGRQTGAGAGGLDPRERLRDPALHQRHHHSGGRAGDGPEANAKGRQELQQSIKLVNIFLKNVNLY